MGTYLNPGKQSYQIAVNSEIFIDKSTMLAYLNSVVNTQQRFVSISRPRRFGKTMAAYMICLSTFKKTGDFRGYDPKMCEFFEKGFDKKFRGAIVRGQKKKEKKGS